MSRLTRILDEKFYPGIEDNWDDTLLRARVLQEVTPESAVLDLGAGAGIVNAVNFRECVASVVGIDLDPRVLENPYLDEGIVGNAESLPFADCTFDLVFSDNVLEHLDRPLLVFEEVKRVLKPGGRFIFKTPNKYHYMPLSARLTPHRFHRFFNRLRGREEVDTFPTRYRANCRKDIERLASMSGMRLDQISFLEGRPEYMRVFAPLYLIGIVYERFVNASRFFEPFRIVLIGTTSKV